jgi:hypothetical protein
LDQWRGGQAENFIKLHKAQLASDRTSCRDPRANQLRLILHTAAHWLLHTLRTATPKRSRWARAEFNTLRLYLIKIAARIADGAARIRVWLPTACPDAAMYTPRWPLRCWTVTVGHVRPAEPVPQPSSARNSNQDQRWE